MMAACRFTEVWQGARPVDAQLGPPVGDGRKWRESCRYMEIWYWGLRGQSLFGGAGRSRQEVALSFPVFGGVAVVPPDQTGVTGKRRQLAMWACHFRQPWQGPLRIRSPFRAASTRPPETAWASRCRETFHGHLRGENPLQCGL